MNNIIDKFRCYDWLAHLGEFGVRQTVFNKINTGTRANLEVLKEVYMRNVIMDIWPEYPIIDLKTHIDVRVTDMVYTKLTGVIPDVCPDIHDQILIDTGWHN